MHKANARALQTSRARQGEVMAQEIISSNIRSQLSMIGTPTWADRRSRIPTQVPASNYRGLLRDARTGNLRMVVSRGGGAQNPRYIGYQIINIPTASQRAGLQQALRVSEAKVAVIRATHQVQDMNSIPISLSVGSQRSGRSGANRLAVANWKQQQSVDVGAVTRKHSANTTLWSAQKNLAIVSGGTWNTPAPIPPFIIQGSGQKLATLSSQSGFDVGKQLKTTNDRFGLNLDVNDITASYVSGGLVAEASNLFNRNKKIDKLKTTLTPVSAQMVNLDQNSDFDLLYDRRESIVNQQSDHLLGLNKIGDEDLRVARIETDLPVFTKRAGEIDGLITGLNTRITAIKKTRKPQELLSTTGSLANYSLKTMVDRRNTLTKIRNEKVDIFNSITDPALRQVTKEQDIPQFDQRIGLLDSDIDRSVKFGESRKQLDIGIVNAQTKRRGRAPKTFDVSIGDDTRTFRRNERGSRNAQLFFNEVKSKRTKEVQSIADPIEKAVTIDQDLGVLDLGIQASNIQRKSLKAEKRQELENMNIGGASSTSGFQPYTPSDTPTGKLQISAIPKRRGVPKIFDQLGGAKGNDFGIDTSRSRGRSNSKNSAFGMGDFGINNFGGESRSRGRSSRPINPSQLDLGNVFGGKSERINKRTSGGFDFF